MEGFSFRNTDAFLPLRLGATARDTLQEFVDIDVTAENLVDILHRNPAYRELFARFVNQKTRKIEGAKAKKEGQEEEPLSPTHRMIGLLGMIGSRNLILALRMHKATEGRFPLAEDGALEVQASDYLKRALEAEETFLRAGLEYSETAFSCGVYYDWLTRKLSRHPDFARLLGPFCDQVWRRSWRSGLVAYFLAREVAGISPKHALAGGFLLHGGKLLLAEAAPSYAEEETEAVESGVPPLQRLLQEREKWGASQEEAGSHSLRYFDLFSFLIPAVRSYREPYALKGDDPLQYRLASLLYLADAMAASWKIPADEKDPVFRLWSHPSVKGLKLRSGALIQVMKSAMAVH